MLDHVDTMTAHAIARGAAAYAAVLSAIDPDAGITPTGAAAVFVEETVCEWRSKTRLFKPKLEFIVGRAPVASGDVLQAAWASARKTFPQFDEGTAAICFLAVLELAVDGLAQIDSPEILLVGAARFAAWSLGGRLKKADPAQDPDSAAALSTVQAWALGRAEPVLHVSYTGKSGSHGQQALSLSQDAAACARLVESRPDLVPRSGAELWQQAAERHAYAGLALDQAALLDVESDLAIQHGMNAMRFIDRLARKDPPMMPLFPRSGVIAERAAVAGSLRWLRRPCETLQPG
ncbi:hypothetical protein [Lichenicola sp.]|uniref:hypothetical protein n=1 Tax=Lichenicola sp. TaxID=2804529 RepID=UPI003B00A00C